MLPVASELQDTTANRRPEIDDDVPPEALQGDKETAMIDPTHDARSARKAFRQLTLDFPPRPSISMDCDADMVRFMKKTSGGSDFLRQNAEIAKYLEKKIMGARPLILTFDKRLARSIRKAGCPATPLPESNTIRGLTQSIAAATFYFDGTYFLMSGQEVFNWRTYELCRDVAAAHDFGKRPFVGLSYVGLPISTVSVATALMNAVGVQYTSYGDTGYDAINFIKTFLTQLVGTPNLESSLAKLAARARPRFSKQIETEILPRAGLDVPLFRKYLRAEKIAVEKARLGQEVQRALCA